MVTVFFIIDGLSLEAHSALLAATLFHHNGARFHYIAYVADRHRAALSPALCDFMALCGVEIRDLPRQSRPWDKDYPHGNKILASLDRRETGHSMFLDTDMLCLGPLDLTPFLAERAIAVVPEGRRSWGSDLDRWVRVYRHFGLELPEERIKLARNRDILFVPYFNAGMILFPEAEVSPGQRFADLWHDTALTIDHEVRVAQKRPWLDQIALPVTLKRFGLSYAIVPEALNYSASNRSLKPGEAPLLLHYHRWSHLATWPDQRQAALEQVRALAGPALYGGLVARYGDFWTAAPPDGTAQD